jgi:hypothetical protein
LREIEDRAEGRPTFVIVTRSTRIRAALLDGKAGSLEAFTRTLRRSRDVQEIYRKAGASIFRVVEAGTPRLATQSGASQDAPGRDATTREPRQGALDRRH